MDRVLVREGKGNSVFRNKERVSCCAVGFLKAKVRVSAALRERAQLFDGWLSGLDGVSYGPPNPCVIVV